MHINKILVGYLVNLLKANNGLGENTYYHKYELESNSDQNIMNW